MIRWLDKLEDRFRQFLSRRPRLYALIAGTAIILFWRGIWHLADEYNMSSWSSIFWGVVIMLATGTFVSFFIGDRIILSGLKAEKRLDEKTVEEIREEDEKINEMRKTVSSIKKELDEVRDELKNK